MDTPSPDSLPTDVPTAVACQSLSVVQAGGFGASLDALAGEPDSASETPRMWLWFVSLIGSQQALKAIAARLLKGDVVAISCEALGQVRFCALAHQGPKGWRTFTAKLPASGGYQLVLLPEVARLGAARQEFLLLPRSPDEAPALHFRFLDRCVDIPLHASWSDWLWARALRTGEAVPLEAKGTLAYRCRPDLRALADDVSAMIRRGELAISDIAAGVDHGASR